MTDDEIIDAILAREGGFVDHPADKGGPTKYGITQDTLSSWRKSKMMAADVASLTVDEARLIYKGLYILLPGFSLIADARLRALVVDCGVNHGTGTATRMLQRALGVKDDGALGPTTRAALEAQGASCYYRVLAERIRFYGRLITNKPSQAVFASGWMNRCAEFLES